MTTTNTSTDTSNIPPGLLEGHATLILRGERDANDRRVTWSEDVVDNEGLGRKSSKVCCIYHKPREFGESSSESSSSSSSGSDNDSDTDSDSSGGPPRQPIRKRDPNAPHDHEHDGPCSHDTSSRGRRSKKPKKKRAEGRRPSPNAYEKMPKYKKKGGSGTTTEVMKPSGGGS